MTKEQLKHLEKRLLDERARVMKELGHYDDTFNSTLQNSDGDLSSYSFHMADQGTDTMEREKQFLLRRRKGGISGTSTRRCVACTMRRTTSVNATPAAN